MQLEELFVQHTVVSDRMKNGQFVSQYLKVNHRGLQSVINKQSRKFKSFAMQNGMSSEDLDMFAMATLLGFIKRFEKETMEFSNQEVRYFEVMLNRKMRDYANSDIRTRKTKEDGTTRNIYVTLKESSLESLTQESEKVEVEDAQSIFNKQDYNFMKSPIIPFLKGKKMDILTKSQIEVFDALIENDMNITRTAESLNRQNSSVERSLKSLSKRLNKAYDKEHDHTRIYSKLLKTQKKIQAFLQEVMDKPSTNIPLLTEAFIDAHIDAEFMQNILYDKLDMYAYNGICCPSTAMKVIGELILYDEFILFFPFKNISDLSRPESSYGKEHNQKIREKQREARQCSNVRVFDKDGNLIEELPPTPLDYNVRYAKLDANGMVNLTEDEFYWQEV